MRAEKAEGPQRGEHTQAHNIECSSKERRGRRGASPGQEQKVLQSPPPPPTLPLPNALPPFLPASFFFLGVRSERICFYISIL